MAKTAQHSAAPKVYEYTYQIIPLPGFVIVEPLKNKSASTDNSPYKLHIFDTMKEVDSAGIVMAVGDPFTFYEGSNAITVTCPVKVGDKIAYKNFGSDRMMDVHGKTIFFVSSASIQNTTKSWEL